MALCSYLSHGCTEQNLSLSLSLSCLPVLGTSRGNAKITEIVERLRLWGVTQLYVIGGNGGNRARSVKKTKIAQAFTEPGQAMQFLFDYGDDWRFEIRWIATGKQYKGKTYPVTLASVGEAPEQYPDWDDDWDEDDEEEDR